MLGQVGRAVELPISLSLGIARRGVGLTLRVADWALTGIVRELSPDRGDGRAEPPEVVYERSEVQAAAVVTEEEVPAPPPDSETAVLEEREVDLSGGDEEHEPGLGTSVREPHSALNNPISEPDLTEWPDPYDHREDPRDPGDEMVFGEDAVHTQTGATSTSEPHPSQDPEAEPAEAPKRDKVDQ